MAANLQHVSGRLGQRLIIPCQRSHRALPSHNARCLSARVRHHAWALGAAELARPAVPARTPLPTHSRACSILCSRSQPELCGSSRGLAAAAAAFVPAVPAAAATAGGWCLHRGTAAAAAAAYATRAAASPTPVTATVAAATATASLSTEAPSAAASAAAASAHPAAAAPAAEAAGTSAAGDAARDAPASASGLPQPGPLGVLVTYYADHWKVPLPEGHRFPMGKYAAVHAALEADPSLQGRLELRPAPPVAWEDVTAVHDPAYVERFRSNRMTEPEMRNVGFPWSEQLVGRTFSSCGGTVAAMHCVMQQGRGIAANIAGGTHHAFRDRGEGFCIFNDIAVAATVAMRDYGLRSVLVIDVDVHQGNGTAELFENDPRVTTFDVFGDKNYPWKTRRRNTYDVPLPDGTGDEEYLALLRSWLPRLLADHSPQLIMFQAGVDALKGDGFGRLGLSRGGLLARNNLVYGAALEAGIPMVITMGGGYTRPMDASVAAHTDVYRTAAYRLAAWQAARGEAVAR